MGAAGDLPAPIPEPTPEPVPEPEPEPIPEPVSAPAPEAAPAEAGTFDWQALCAYMERELPVGIYHFCLIRCSCVRRWSIRLSAACSVPVSPTVPAATRRLLPKV